MQTFLRACANQQQYRPPGAVAWSIGAGPGEPVHVAMVLTLTASSGGAVTANGDAIALPYVVREDDQLGPLPAGGGSFTFTVTLAPGDAVVTAATGFDLIDPVVDGATLTVTNNGDPESSGSTAIQLRAARDGCVDAAISFAVVLPS